MKVHTRSSGQLTCHICFYQMSDQEVNAFKDHVKKHAHVTLKQCVICDEIGNENFDLRYHVQRHVSDYMKP